MLVKHLEESGEEALAAVQYRRQYSRHDGRGAMVYTRGLHQAVDLESWLHAQENGPDVDAPNHDCIVLVPCRGKVVGEDVSRLIRLSAQWSIPGEVMRHLLNPHRDWGTEKMRDNTRWNSWTIHIPILLDVFVCQLAIGSLQVDGISQIRAVAFVPTSTISAFNEVASVFVAGESPLSTLQFRSAWLQVLFIWTGVRKWEQFTADFAGGVREQTKALIRTEDHSSTSMAMGISDQLIDGAMRSVEQIGVLRRHARSVTETLQQPTAAAPTGAHALLLELSRDAEVYLDACSTKVETLSRMLDSRLKVYLAKVQINSTGFVRENIISMRRIAEGNEAQAAELRRYTKEAREDARDMKRLAFLTMFYLPATVVAAVFSTPFLSLNDDLEFNALGKIWIFFVASITLTTATFAISALFDRLSRRGQGAVQGSGGTAGTEAASHDVNRSVLEPGLWTDPQSWLLQELSDDTESVGTESSRDSGLSGDSSLPRTS